MVSLGQIADPWSGATFGPLGATLAFAVLAYWVVGEPPFGRWAAERLRRTRATDAAALRDFYRLTVGCLWASAAVVLLVVAVEPGLTLTEIGWQWPQLPAGIALGVVTGAFIGLAIGVGVGIVLARRGRTPAPAPETVAFLLPVTANERRWAAGVAVTAGVAEELVFRGLFLALAIGLGGLSPLLAAVCVSVVFGVAHLYQGAQGVLVTGLLGGLLAAIVLNTESLLPAIALHVLVDLRSLLPTPPAS